MKRSATVVAGLFLLSAWLARPVAAQSTAPGCGRAVISRVAVAPDSTRTLSSLTCKNVHDTVTKADSAALKVALATVKTLRDSIAKLLAVTPPQESTPHNPPPPPPPPPADSGRDSTPKPPAGNVLFRQDWTSTTLPKDGQTLNGWQRWSGADVIAVVPAAGLGFPAGLANVLRVQMGVASQGGTAYDWLQLKNGWTAPAVGESRAYRLYFRNAVGNVSGGWSATHPVEGNGNTGGTGDDVWSWKFGTNTDGTFGIVFVTPNAAWPRDNITLPNWSGGNAGFLSKSQTYRLEWKWTRNSATYSIAIRIYGQDGKLLYDNATLRYFGGGAVSADAGGFTLGENTIRSFRIGTNGGFSVPSGMARDFYYGAFAVCSDWCGAY